LHKLHSNNQLQDVQSIQTTECISKIE